MSLRVERNRKVSVANFWWIRWSKFRPLFFLLLLAFEGIFFFSFAKLFKKTKTPRPQFSRKWASQKQSLFCSLIHIAHSVHFSTKSQNPWRKWSTLSNYEGIVDSAIFEEALFGTLWVRGSSSPCLPFLMAFGLCCITQPLLLRVTMHFYLGSCVHTPPEDSHSYGKQSWLFWSCVFDSYSELNTTGQIKHILTW